MRVARYVGVLVAGVALYCLAYHPWLPYSVRERSMHGTDFLMLMLGAFASGVAGAWGSRTDRLPVACTFLGAMCIANAMVIAGDWKVDPTDHNLLPFEFVILAVLASPSLAGAWLGAWLGTDNKKGGAVAPPDFTKG